MGNTIFIRNKRVCVKPLRSRIVAIQRLKPPTMIKECRRFTGMVNCVSIFCPELQKHLKPFYDHTRKGRHFVWGEEQQKAFEEIMVNCVSIFCPELQKLLKLFYDHTREGRHFVWGEEQQEAFEEIKGILQRPPVLHLPDRQG